MKRVAFIISSDDPSVGTEVDVKSYIKFLMSPQGGYWCRNEIFILKGYPSSTILCGIKAIKNYYKQLDYCICIFTGHGSMQRRGEDIIVYPCSNDPIHENDLLGIAKRQLSIFDCCRCLPERVDEHEKVAASNLILNSSNIIDVAAIRKAYDERICSSLEFQYRLYACSEGEYANGWSSKGGAFSQALIKSVEKGYDIDPYLSINTAFNRAREICTEMNQNQTPEARLHRCGIDKNVIWAINPLCYTRPRFC